MKCTKCSTELRKTQKFCHECGMKVILMCTNCNEELSSGDKFCSECGTPTMNSNSGNKIYENEIEQIKLHKCQGMKFNLGDYIKFGKFKGRDLLWIVINHDTDNNPMLFSEKVICNSSFGERSSWKTSSLRLWLNNESIETELNPISLPDAEYVLEDEEQGFLNNNNFNAYEYSLIKLTEYKVELREMEARNIKEYKGGDTVEDIIRRKNNEIGPTNNIDEKLSEYVQEKLSKLKKLDISFENVISETLKDRVFLLSFDEILSLYNRGFSELIKSKYLIKYRNPVYYWLRTPLPNHMACVLTAGYNNSIDYDDRGSNHVGVRPALYLDKNNIDNITGDGSKDNPFILRYY